MKNKNEVLRKQRLANLLDREELALYLTVSYKQHAENESINHANCGRVMLVT